MYSVRYSSVYRWWEELKTEHNNFPFQKHVTVVDAVTFVKEK